MKRAGHAALAVEFADVAHIDEGDVSAPVQSKGVLDRQSLDLALGVVDERTIADGLIFGQAWGCPSRYLPTKLGENGLRVAPAHTTGGDATARSSRWRRGEEATNSLSGAGGRAFEQAAAQ